ncbi:putative mitochondrial protein [Vitis vinifera]|uniref:Putative mitochondrial protein n=1 Tax=Vitis vinifera TaxID=29760 RepID=A0A438BYP3_VITVI|nr:putative mitochondrial protein [Vitis vinifera]
MRPSTILKALFVQGRQILDAVLIANEIVDERRRSGEEGVVFKIDFEKAYDHVKWDFLDHMLEKKGFSPRWRKWMSGCLSSVSYAILVNGSAKGWVKASRGLRQGDPLSSFLFTLVADVLSRMLMRAEERNMMEGFRVGRNRTRVSHLQFVDDTIFFSNSREEELQTLKSLLLVFGHISGLKASGWPILYLGLPLGGNPKACGFWIQWGWGRQKGSFSEVGCCVQTKTIGGLGLGNISWRNLALLGKWLWSKMVTSLSLEGYCLSLSGVFFDYSMPDYGHYPLQGFFSVKSFFLALSQSSGSSQNFPSKFVWNSQVPFKVKCFVWLVAHKKVNTNDMLQVRRPYKVLSPDICILCMKHGESADHLFLHCSLTIGLWHRLFQLAKMDWVPPRSIYDMMSIKFKGFGNSKRGIVLWQAVSIALIRVVWWERNARIFEDKARNSGFLWDSIVFLASLWAFCSKAFKGFPLM